MRKEATPQNGEAINNTPEKPKKKSINVKLPVPRPPLLGRNGWMSH